MQSKLKHIFFMACLSFAAMACGGGMAKPVSGLDVSLLSPSLLTISPKTADIGEADFASGQQKADIDGKTPDGSIKNKSLTINPAKRDFATLNNKE